MSSVSIQLGIFVLCNTTTQWQVTVCIRHAILCIKTLQYKNVNAINKKNVSLNVFMKCKNTNEGQLNYVNYSIFSCTKSWTKTIYI